MNLEKKISKSKFVKWVNRTITHNRDDEGDFGIRVLLHIPAGIFSAITFPVGVLFCAAFIFYEKNEDWHVRDEAWKDTFGYLVGLVFGTIGWFTLLLILL